MNPIWTEGTFGTFLVTSHCCVNSVQMTNLHSSIPAALMQEALASEKVSYSSSRTDWEPVVFCLVFSPYAEAHTLSGLLWHQIADKYNKHF